MRLKLRRISSKRPNLGRNSRLYVAKREPAIRQAPSLPAATRAAGAVVQGEWHGMCGRRAATDGSGHVRGGALS